MVHHDIMMLHNKTSGMTDVPAVLKYITISGKLFQIVAPRMDHRRKPNVKLNLPCRNAPTSTNGNCSINQMFCKCRTLKSSV